MLPEIISGGVFAPFLENILNAALEVEMNTHLDANERNMENRRNGHVFKQV